MANEASSVLDCCEHNSTAVVTAVVHIVDQEGCAQSDTHIEDSTAVIVMQAVGQEAYAIVAGEIGGGNGLEALNVAADMGLPVVDADFMGRAFPELQVCQAGGSRVSICQRNPSMPGKQVYDLEAFPHCDTCHARGQD